MSSEEWRTLRVSDICTKVVSGGTPSTRNPDYYDGSIPWLKTQEINFNRIYETKTKITDEGLKNSSAKWIPANSVIMAMYGATAGKIAINKAPITTNQACCNLIINDDIADYRYIYYNLMSRFQEIASMAVGGAQQNLNAEMIRDLEIPLPSLSIQRRIADVLSTLDDKIELNRQTNATLEAIAQAIFKEWFVDFNYPGATGELIDTPLGPIPKGWQIKTLQDLTSLKNGVNYSRGEKGDREFPIVNVRNIVEKKLLHSIDLDTISLMANKADDYYLTENDILMARSASPGEVTMMYGDLTDVIFSGFVIRVRIIEPSLKNLIFLSLLIDKEKLLFLSNGTTLKSINQEVLNNYSVRIPDQSIISMFNSYFDIFKNKIINNLKEIKTLSLIRDTLLRKYFDGQRE